MQNITLIDPKGVYHTRPHKSAEVSLHDFQSILDAKFKTEGQGAAPNSIAGPLERERFARVLKSASMKNEALSAYQKQTQGTDYRETRPIPDPLKGEAGGPPKVETAYHKKEGEGFFGAIAKGISGFFKGIADFFQNFFSGDSKEDQDSGIKTVSTSDQSSAHPGTEMDGPAAGQKGHFSVQSTDNPPPAPHAASAYQDLADPVSGMTDWEKYKDDQLLSNPGGDHYDLEQNKMITDSADQESFLGRVGKDLSDAFGNVKNFFSNLFFGSKIRYRDENNQIQEAGRRGLIGSVGEFFKDLGSALSFGAWRPDGEEEPQGFGERVGFFFSKVKEAVFGDLVQGVAGSVLHMGEDLVLAGWNLMEVIPDATIGNFQKGQKLTTTIFDNGQVIIDYLTDVLPTGDAWLRVHSADLGDLKPSTMPIMYNLNMPEHYDGDARWQYLRNTPFRKKIETIGSLLADVCTLEVLGQTQLFSEKND